MEQALGLNSEFVLTRLLLHRGLAFIYLIAFLIVLNQGRALIGTNGLLPAPFFIKNVGFFDSPSLFFFHFSDATLLAVAGVGIALSSLALLGISENFGPLFSATIWFILWLLYLSIVNVGQVFYGFGWETLLLESGFLAVFLGSKEVAPPVLVIWLYRWLVFRLMFGAGLIKIRGDECWRDLTCMYYHYETQPLPNPLSWYFHHLPKAIHRAAVLFTHFVELVVPFGYFWPSLVRNWAGVLTIFFQATLIASGNLSWLNCITIVVSFSCLDDSFISRFLPLKVAGLTPLTSFHQWAVYGLTALVAYLSVQPVRNLLSNQQAMNASFEPLHLVNTYGAFGSVTQIRREIVLEGTLAPSLLVPGDWLEYEFKGKPGDVSRAPCVVTPYHYKLDWQMWFAAMSPYYQHPWILNLISKLLRNDRTVLNLLARNPFSGGPPRFVRARLYEYHFTGPGAENWWQRKPVGEYLPPLSLDDPDLQRIMRQQGWSAF